MIQTSKNLGNDAVALGQIRTVCRPTSRSPRRATLAILARALIHDYPEYDMYWNIPAIQFGKRVMRQLQYADRPLRRRRRHENRISSAHRASISWRSATRQQQAADRRGCSAPSPRPIAALRPRACWSVASTAARAVLADAVARLGGNRSRQSNMAAAGTCAMKCAARTASVRPPEEADDEDQRGSARTA